MWVVPGMKHITFLPGVTSTRVDFCQHGRTYHTKTKLVSYDFDITSISKVCKTRNGICPRSGEPHELPTGAVGCPNDQLHLLEDKVRAGAIAKALKFKPCETDTNPTIWKTKLAEPYPVAFCDAMATMM